MGSTIRKDLRSIPNIITLSRIVLIWLGVLVYFYVSHGVGIALSILAGVTDYLDGYVARRTKQVTRLGEILDQFCDLCFESFILIIATLQGFFPTYLSISGFVPAAEPYLGHFGRLAVGLGIAAGYYSALGYTKVFAAGYAEATSRIN